MKGLALTCIRDEKTFKYKDDTYKRVRYRETATQWFVLRDSWVQLKHGVANDMENRFLVWKATATLKVSA